MTATNQHRAAGKQPAIHSEKVKRLKDAQFAVCRDCGQTHDALDPYWGVAQYRWMHERGTGHRVDYYRFGPTQ